jgi:hypothetical protein
MSNETEGITESLNFRIVSGIHLIKDLIIIEDLMRITLFREHYAD